MRQDRKTEKREDRPAKESQKAYHCSTCGYTAYGYLAYVDVRAHIVNAHMRNGAG